MNVLYTEAVPLLYNALFLCDPLYGFINDKVKEKSHVSLTSSVVGKGALLYLQWAKECPTQALELWWASGMLLGDDSPQALPELPHQPGLGSDYNEFFRLLARRETQLKLI